MLARKNFSIVNIKSGFHELAKQDNKHGRAVFFQRKFTFIG